MSALPLIVRLGRWLWREPLVLFFVAGLGLFAAHHVFDGDARVIDESVIEVDRKAIIRFMQYRRNISDAATAAQAWEAMLPSEQRQVVDQFVREEALYREARSWGLDRDDNAIRRRLVQSIEFVLEGPAKQLDVPGELELRSYYAAHLERYRQNAEITFSHVFFSADASGMAQAERRARQALLAISRDRVDQTELGDRFLYHTSYARQSKATVESHFGAGMAGELFGMAPTREWRGPIRSIHGAHLVQISRVDPGSLLPFETVRPRVEIDAMTARRDRLKEQAVLRIVASYRARVSSDIGTPR
jgi:peptidyl-prolyl cis-trans isomerase C